MVPQFLVECNACGKKRLKKHGRKTLGVKKEDEIFLN